MSNEIDKTGKPSQEEQMAHGKTAELAEADLNAISGSGGTSTQRFANNLAGTSKVAEKSAGAK